MLFNILDPLDASLYELVSGRIKKLGQNRMRHHMTQFWKALNLVSDFIEPIHVRDFHKYHHVSFAADCMAPFHTINFIQLISIGFTVVR